MNGHPHNQKKNYWKKMIAPVVITILLVLYFILYAAAASELAELPAGIRTAGVLIPLAFTCVLIAMLIERIKEIRSGEEDDLSKY